MPSAERARAAPTRALDFQEKVVDRCGLLWGQERGATGRARAQAFTDKSLDFQEKIIDRSGLGDETYLPDGARPRLRARRGCLGQRAGFPAAQRVPGANAAHEGRAGAGAPVQALRRVRAASTPRAGSRARHVCVRTDVESTALKGSQRR